VCYTTHTMGIATKDKAEQAHWARLYREEQAKAHLSIRIDRDVFDILTKTAEELRISRGAIVERALDFYFKVALLAPEKLPPAWLS
jgi:transketolase